MTRTRADATFVATASFAAGRVDDALPYLTDVVHNVGLDPDIAADLVLGVYEEMRSAATPSDARDVGVRLELGAATLTVTVNQSLSPTDSTDAARYSVPWGHERSSVTSWRIPAVTMIDAVGPEPELDRSALVAGLASASASASAASVAGQARRSMSIEVAVDKRAPTFVRQHVSHALRANEIADDVHGDVLLMVSELVSNVIRHEDTSTIDIEVAVDLDNTVTITVTGGVAKLVPALLHPADPPPVTSLGGRGLGVVDSLASVWGTRRQHGKTAVWFTVRGVGAVPRAHRHRPRAASQRLAGTTVSDVALPTIRSLTPTSEAATAAVAVAVVANEEAVAAATEAQLTTEPEVLAVQAAVTAENAAADAATKTADAARAARAARAVAATVAAKGVAEAAARTVEAVQAQADGLALAAATAASAAASMVSNSVTLGGDAQAARTAREVGATVISAAVAKAEETAQAAILVARAVAAAAAAVAATTAQEAAAMEEEVFDAALAVRAVTAATAQQLATETFDRAAAVAGATRAAAESSERLREANLQLQRAGRHDRTVALALQEAMLTRLPDSTNLRLAARYLTAAEQDQVGGDWYDALVLPSGTTTLVIGDVIGHDIVAAGVMGQLRNLLRALVWDRDEPPSAVVTRLDRAIRDLHIDTIASLILVSVEPPAPGNDAAVSLLRWTNAGHPAPILIHVDGTAEALADTTDLLLGIDPDVVRRDHTHPVPADATLLLYTDGLVETRVESIDAGQRRLLAAARTHYRLEPGALIDAVLADMVGDRPADDVAVLAVRFQNPRTAVSDLDGATANSDTRPELGLPAGVTG